jgi:hypothetical protein
MRAAMPQSQDIHSPARERAREHPLRFAHRVRGVGGTRHRHHRHILGMDVHVNRSGLQMAGRIGLEFAREPAYSKLPARLLTIGLIGGRLFRNI